MTNTPVLALFNPNLETVLSADASAFGLGAVLLQRQPSGKLKPVAFISRSMTPTEQRYAQIKKEALAFTWACERLSDYLIGLPFHIHTDHKPLVPLFSSKHLEELPIRVQHFRLRMMRFQFSISHVPGKDLIVADALSRAPVAQPTSADELLQQEAGVFVQVVLQSIPATEERMDMIRDLQLRDPTLPADLRVLSIRLARQALATGFSETLLSSCSGDVRNQQPADERQSNSNSSTTSQRDAQPNSREPPGHYQVPREGPTVGMVARNLKRDQDLSPKLQGMLQGSVPESPATEAVSSTAVAMAEGCLGSL